MGRLASLGVDAVDDARFDRLALLAAAAMTAAASINLFIRFNDDGGLANAIGAAVAPPMFVATAWWVMCRRSPRAGAVTALLMAVLILAGQVARSAEASGAEVEPHQVAEGVDVVVA